MGTHRFKINGHDYEVTVKSINEGNASVTVNGTEYSVAIENGSGMSVSETPITQPSRAEAAPNRVATSSNPGSAIIKSPLPGVITEINVKEGQSVKRGQKLAVIEAMKMENEIQAETDGTVTAILVQKGDSILEGAEIIKLG